MKTNDYVKYMTQEMVKRMNQPKAVVEERKRQKKLQKEPYASKWFGMIPMAISLWLQKIVKK